MKVGMLFSILVNLFSSFKEFLNFNHKTSENKSIFQKNTKKGMGVYLIKHILDAEKATPALHDIKIKLSSNLHSYLVEKGYVLHKNNKMIQLEMNNTCYTTVKFIVYPETILIDIGCSEEPVTYLPEGATRLASLLAEIHYFLCAQSSHKAKIDEIEKWELIHHHKNKDGKITYEGEVFHILLEDALGGVTRAYSKHFSDGSTFVRIEEIRREKMPITKLLENMRNVKANVTQIVSSQV